MKKILMMMLMVLSLTGYGKEMPEGMVLVTKGSLPDIGNGKIIIKEDFYIGKYEVTQKEFQAIMGFNQSKFKGDNLPVDNVTWYDALAYCNELSNKEKLPAYYEISEIMKNLRGNITRADVSILGGKGYRLPTSDEWEYAARGGQKSKGYVYSGSNNVEDVAWSNSNSGGKKQLVGTKNANEIGIYDMSGNVLEWSVTQGITGLSGHANGGSWVATDDRCAVDKGRTCYPPGCGYYFLGFRILRSY